MNLHLAEIAATVAPAAHAVLLVDQAGWHMSTRLIVPANITIIPLPPKCPELNPVENVWQFLRDNWLSNHVFKSYDDLVDHCCASLSIRLARSCSRPRLRDVTMPELTRLVLSWQRCGRTLSSLISPSLWCRSWMTNAAALAPTCPPPPSGRQFSAVHDPRPDVGPRRRDRNPAVQRSRFSRSRAGTWLAWGL